jgi:3-deoxy-7-phosphoheptulonate synthase
MYKILGFFLLSLYLTNGFQIWSPTSWRSKVIRQVPTYENKTELIKIEKRLRQKPPLIFAKECENLKRDLAKVANGDAFVIMGGDCAETFDDFDTVTIRDLYKLLLQIGILQTYASGKKTIKIARAAGQFAKPRSNDFETQDNVTLPVFRGDIINSNEFTPEARKADPKRMLQAYDQSVETINLLRAFSSGGFASLHQLQKWNLLALQRNELTNPKLIYGINHALKFFDGLGLPFSHPLLSQTTLYTGHECLLLHYEEALTRKDSLSKKYYDCSSHFIWIGDRTRDLDSAHVEFCRGVQNPIGIKISKETNVTELVQIMNTLNPTNEYGKITLITRFGVDEIDEHFPPIIKTISKEIMNVVWCCDPMHGNGKNVNGTKTRYVEDIQQEIRSFFSILKLYNQIPGGIHLEMTPLNVTECIHREKNQTLDNYKTLCDPRLNPKQALSLFESSY